MPLTALGPRAALVVIDLQRGVVGAPAAPHSAADVVRRSAQLAAAFRERELPVVLVRVSFAADGGDMLATRTDAGFAGRERPAGWDQIVPELGPAAGDIVVTKRQWGAFHGTGLDVDLRRRGITDIVLTGIATNFGVESTARAAHEHGYNVVAVEDAMTTREAGDHEFAVRRIFPRLGEVETTDGVLAALERLA